MNSRPHAPNSPVEFTRPIHHAQPGNAAATHRGDPPDSGARDPPSQQIAKEAIYTTFIIPHSVFSAKQPRRVTAFGRLKGKNIAGQKNETGRHSSGALPIFLPPIFLPAGVRRAVRSGPHAKARRSKARPGHAFFFRHAITRPQFALKGVPSEPPSPEPGPASHRALTSTRPDGQTPPCPTDKPSPSARRSPTNSRRKSCQLFRPM